jgi:hypothetical protein
VKSSPHNEPELPVLDSPPRSGVFIDHDAAPLTEDDIALGNVLGEEIDPDDDDDNGTGLL